MVRRVGLTTDFESVRSALDAVTVVGDTSLRDALFLALHTAAPEATRPLLLIFTDGADTSGLLLADEMLESVRDANLVIHAVSFGYQPFLKQATHEAGGRVWSASSDRDLQKLFSRAIRDMRDRYVLAYTPDGVSRSGRHTLSVNLTRAKGHRRSTGLLGQLTLTGIGAGSSPDRNNAATLSPMASRVSCPPQANLRNS